MSTEEAEVLMEQIERKWQSKHKKGFIDRMERKLTHKEKGYKS